MGASRPHRLISEDEFLNAVRGISRSAFRMETRGSYALGYERADFERFVAGSPVPPIELDWYRPWLDRVSRWSREGKTVSRVRVLDQPPTMYQRWMVWATPWHAEAGEDIRYIYRATAQQAGLPLAYDWWMLDDDKVIIMHFTAEGEIDHKELVTDAESVAMHRAWRDMAGSHAFAAENVPAA